MATGYVDRLVRDLWKSVLRNAFCTEGSQRNFWITSAIFVRFGHSDKIWSNGGMILTGETKVLGDKHYTVWVVDGWMSMEQRWNGTDRGNWSTGRKTLYSVCGRWMNEYGAMVEWYWQRKTEVLGEKYYTAWVVDGWMSMEQWGNDTDRGKLKYWEKNIIQCGW